MIIPTGAPFEYMENAARQRRIFESSPEPVDDPADAEQSSSSVSEPRSRSRSRNPPDEESDSHSLHNSPGTVIMILFIPMSLTAGVMMRFMWLIPLLILTMFFPQLQATLRVTRISALA